MTPDTVSRVYAIAEALPYQGEWYDRDYLTLLRLCGNRLAEMSDGYVELLPHPTCTHQGDLGNLVASSRSDSRHLGTRLIIAPFESTRSGFGAGR